MLSYEMMKKIFFKFSPERAHEIVEFVFKNSSVYCPFIPSYLSEKYFFTDPRIEQNLLGTKFLNPIGLAAGFDKNATMIKMLNALGFGHIEFGTVTPKPQEGNPKPRLFRYPEFESIQNAMGFNNDGLSVVSRRIGKIYPYAIPLGANIGKNKTTPQEDALDDYKELINGFKNLCDYFAINISSPNTPNLRDLQNEEFIKELFSMAANLTKKPLLLKIAPDMQAKDAIKLCGIAIENGASGIIATNTTTDYSLLPNAKSFGGISGKVLKEKSRTLFKELGREFCGKTTLISVGGIDSVDEAYERIKDGASLIQIYSAFIFKGPKLNYEISKGILDRMNSDGIHHISELIGVNHK